MSVLELIRPRICHIPDCDESLGTEAVAWARDVGMTLDPEQELVFESGLGLGADGRWQSREVGINMPRQNGKGEILIARELYGLYELGENFIVHSAHEFKTSEKHFARIEAVIRSCPELLAEVKRAPGNPNRIIGFRYSHGDEAIELQDGRRIEFRTRTKGGMRGFDDVALLVLDEVMIFSQAQQAAMMPTVRASKAERGPQIWYAGSAVDQEIHEHGLVWARVRERGIAGEDPELTYFEWSLDFEHPDDVPDEVASDPVYWRMVNFAIERGRVPEAHMAFEYRSLLLRSFIVELLGVGDWPATDGSVDVLISQAEWAALHDPDSVLVDPICVAFDVSPERHASVVAAGRNERGQMMVEVIHARSGTGWLEERLVDLYREHEVAQVVCDGYGPAAAIANRVDEAGITVHRMDSGDYGKACGLFVDHVGERTLRHLGQQELDGAIRGAKARPLVDRWAWSRTKSTVNISPLVAATLALWSATENDVGTVAIY